MAAMVRIALPERHEVAERQRLAGGGALRPHTATSASRGRYGTLRGGGLPRPSSVPALPAAARGVRPSSRASSVSQFGLQTSPWLTAIATSAAASSLQERASTSPRLVDDLPDDSSSHGVDPDESLRPAPVVVAEPPPPPPPPPRSRKNDRGAKIAMRLAAQGKTESWTWHSKSHTKRNWGIAGRVGKLGTASDLLGFKAPQLRDAAPHWWTPPPDVGEACDAFDSTHRALGRRADRMHEYMTQHGASRSVTKGLGTQEAFDEALGGVRGHRYLTPAYLELIRAEIAGASLDQHLRWRQQQNVMARLTQGGRGDDEGNGRLGGGGRGGGGGGGGWRAR